MVGVAAGGADEAVKPAGARDVGRQRDRGRDFRRVWNAEEPITLMFDKRRVIGYGFEAPDMGLPDRQATIVRRAGKTDRLDSVLMNMASHGFSVEDRRIRASGS